MLNCLNLFEIINDTVFSPLKMDLFKDYIKLLLLFIKYAIKQEIKDEKYFFFYQRN